MTIKALPLLDHPQLLTRLASEIRNKHRSHLIELRIEVVEGGVILNGQAYSYYGKQIAQHEVLRRLNLVLLANRIQVAPRREPNDD